MAAVRAGALSYLMKDSPPEKLVEAIQAAYRGEPTLHPRTAEKLLQEVRQAQKPAEPMTAKEKEVLALLVKGCSNKEIAAVLNISVTTVKTHTRTRNGNLQKI